MPLPVPAAVLAKMIDHSLLHPTMTDAEIQKGLELAKRYGTATCCVKPYSVVQATRALSGSGVGVCAVMGFPHGNSTTKIKIAEAMQCIDDGATELDMVVNNGKVLGGDWQAVEDEVAAINQAVTGRAARLKVIFETDYLKDEHIIKLCQICSKAKVAWIKTSTGYGFVKQPSGDYNYRGATEHCLRLMRQHAAPEVQIKAAGGVRTLAELIRCRELGCTRVGASATQAMMEEALKVERGNAG
jgi:deoxyribose-phosphate aldolase